MFTDSLIELIYGILRFVLELSFGFWDLFVIWDLLFGI